MFTPEGEEALNTQLHSLMKANGELPLVSLLRLLNNFELFKDLAYIYGI